jgi:Sec-independent protein translocase protein TatA
MFLRDLFLVPLARVVSAVLLFFSSKKMPQFAKDLGRGNSLFQGFNQGLNAKPSSETTQQAISSPND